MKKHIYSVICIRRFCDIGVGQLRQRVDVKVPFEFKAGTSTLPAGTYRVTETNSGYVLIRGEKGGGSSYPKAPWFVDTDEPVRRVSSSTVQETITSSRRCLREK